MATLRTVATEMLGIEYPVVCGGMTATGSAELAAGVSNAGGLGMLTCLHCRTPDNLNLEIARCRSLTSKPFGVNLTILGEKRGEPEYPQQFVDVIVRNKIRVVETCGSSRALMTKLHKSLRDGGVKVIIHKCVKVSQAKRAEEQLGVDMISLMGFDSGGLPGEADTGIFVQCALARQELSIPFLLSGGVAHGSQLVAAIALGAAGVQIGTRFNATTECVKFGPNFKKRMIQAGPKDTVIVMKSFSASSRVLKNRDAQAILDVEARGGGKAGLRAGQFSFKDISTFAKFDRLREGMQNDDADQGIWNCGQSVALINDVISCQEFIQRLLMEAESSLRTVVKQFGRARL